MKIDRPVVHSKDLDRVVLLVKDSLTTLKGTFVHHYLKYGEQATFASKKSKSVPIPQRSTCAARERWYDLTKLVKPGFAFWPKSQQYRHIIPANPEKVIGNCNLYDVASDCLSSNESKALVAILNSTLVGLFKTFYGRFAGTEGNLKTEVVDVNLLEVPDPRGIDPNLAKKMAKLLKSLCERPVGRLVEEQLMECHSPERARRIGAGSLVLSNELKQEDRRELDDSVFELLGVSDTPERASLVRRLHEAAADHFRAVRVVEIEKMEQRSKTQTRRFDANELAADAWDAAELADATPLKDRLAKHPKCRSSAIIPEERPAMFSPSPMFDAATVYFGKRSPVRLECISVDHAKLVVQVANLGISGSVSLPENADDCAEVLQEMGMRLNETEARFRSLAESRTSDPALQTQLIDQLRRWFILGRKTEDRTPDS